MTVALPPTDIAGAMVAIRAGRVTATDLVVACLRQIDSVEGRVNAFISIDQEGALERAAEVDRRIAEGLALGRLAGIPIAVKDNLATKRLPTTLGSQICQSWQPGFDATVVRKLLAAGAILLGKNNLHEFALGATNINPHYGDVHNPWDLTRMAGGSSGGSAAAVAAGEVLASIGSDSGGSIRVPAGMCGVVGFKPTYGRISLHGLVGGARSIDHVGPITRTVHDAALLYEVAAGFDPNDTNSSGRRVSGVVAQLDDDTRRIRIGVVEGGSMGGLDREVEQLTSAAAQRLADCGMDVDAASLPGLDDAPFATAVIAYSEVGEHHQDWIRYRADEYGEDTRPLMQLGQLFSARQYLAAQRARDEFRRVTLASMRPFDVLMLPTTPVRAPRLDGVADDDSAQDPKDLFTLMRFAVLFNLTGLPAITVPAGLDSLGLPVGVQFVARAYQESTLLRVARAHERAAGFSHDWPLGRVEPA